MTSNKAAPVFTGGGHPKNATTTERVRMTDIENAVTDAFAGVFESDPGLAERSALVDFTHRWNSVVPAHLRKTAGEIESAFNLTPKEIADTLGLNPQMVEDFMAGDPNADIDIPATALHGFDDTFGREESR